MLQRHAYTLIEILIVISVIAILSVSLVFSFGGLQKKANFDDQKIQTLHLMQKARSLALSSMVVNDDTSNPEPTDYYLLAITPITLTLSAHGTEGTDLSLDTLDFGTDYSIDKSLDIYYFPPNAEICFTDPECTDVSDQTFTLTSSDSKHSATFSITAQGGYPEVE